MNTLNRVLVVVVAGVLLISSLLLGLVPRYISLQLIGVTEQMQTTASTTGGWLLISAISLLIAAACAFVLWLEFRSPGQRTVLVSRVSGGETRVTVGSIQDRLKFHIDQVGQVLEVASRIQGKDRKINVTLDILTSPDVDIKTKSEQVSGIARDVLESKMGVRVGRIKVNVRQEPYPREGTGPAKT